MRDTASQSTFYKIGKILIISSVGVGGVKRRSYKALCRLPKCCSIHSLGTVMSFSRFAKVLITVY